VKLAEALEDRASFRRFCGFAAEEPTPERTAFVRFRRELLARNLDRVSFAAVMDQLDAQGVIVKTGTLVDATLIPSASLKDDDEARWAGHRRKKPVHGYKAHIATDEAGGLVRSVEITTANIHDGVMLDAVLPPDPGNVYADSADSAGRFTEVIRARGGVPTRGLHPYLGWSCGSGPARGLERRGSCRALPDREGVWDLEAVVWVAPDALVGACQGGAASAPHGHRLQPASFGGDLESQSGVTTGGVRLCRRA
jgi:hypothetical protein